MITFTPIDTPHYFAVRAAEKNDFRMAQYLSRLAQPVTFQARERTPVRLAFGFAKKK